MVRKNHLTTILTNRDFYIILALVAFTLITNVAATFYKTAILNKAPQIKNCSWQEHPNALLLCYPLADYCRSCNLSISGWTILGLQHHLDVVVVADKNNEELIKLRKDHPSTTLSIVSGIDKSIINRFSVGDQIGAVHVRNGYIVTRQLGGTPPDSFFS